MAGSCAVVTMLRPGGTCARPALAGATGRSCAPAQARDRVENGWPARCCAALTRGRRDAQDRGVSVARRSCALRLSGPRLNSSGARTAVLRVACAAGTGGEAADGEDRQRRLEARRRERAQGPPAERAQRPPAERTQSAAPRSGARGQRPLLAQIQLNKDILGCLTAGGGARSGGGTPIYPERGERCHCAASHIETRKKA